MLKDEERLSKDVNSLDNVIAVCRICHKKFDTPRTIEEYRSWVRLKKKLLQDAQLICNDLLSRENLQGVTTNLFNCY